MIIPIVWTERKKIQNLPKLLDKVKKDGGSIIQYHRIFSVVVLSRHYPVFDWLPPGKSRTLASIKHVIFCFLLGWWSFGGWLVTPAIIINNLLGGIDVTKVFTQPPALPGQSFDSTAMGEFQRAKKRQQYVFIGYLILLFVLVIIFMVIPSIRRFR